MTADPTTWATLKGSLANWINRDDMSVTEIPEAIALAERRFNRTLRVPEMEELVTSSVSAETITLPTDFLEMRAAYLNTDPKIPLEQLSLANLRNTYSTTVTGKPQNYALQSGNEMVLGPAPDATYSVNINYYQAIPALGASQATNWLLTAHPDLYLWASLAELHNLLMDDQRADRFESKVAGRIEELRAQAQRKAWGATPIRIRSSVIV